MTSFAELYSDVLTIVNRPDKETLIKNAIKEATLKVHTLEFFPKDLMETGISFATPAYVQSIEYTAVFTRFRHLSYLRKYDGTNAGAFLEIISPAEVVDRYGFDRQDVCYIAGINIEVKSSTQDQYMLIGYYQFPTVTEDGYSSWIADNYKWAIVHEAAAKVAAATGYTSMYSMEKSEADSQQMLILSREISGVNI